MEAKSLTKSHMKSNQSSNLTSQRMVTEMSFVTLLKPSGDFLSVYFDKTRVRVVITWTSLNVIVYIVIKIGYLSVQLTCSVTMLRAHNYAT